MRVLVANTGSSSVKLHLLGPANDLMASRDFDITDGRVDPEDVAAALAGLGEIDAVGHRIVHGGEKFHAPVLVDQQVIDHLGELTDLAPLHQPKALAALAALRRELPRTPQVACFDTMFHATLAPEVTTYALPHHWRHRYGLRRYGFHGLSHAYAARRSQEMLGADPGRLVVAHLGAGASLSAVRHGRCVDTTMGFTPLEGLVMATRSGDVDPGLVLWLLDRHGLDLDELRAGLQWQGGLMGLTGTADMREVLERAGSGEAEAALGRDVYLHRLRAKIAAMAAALDGLDTLVYTGGVGQNAPQVRAGAAQRLGFLGVTIDVATNDSAAPDTEVTGAGARVRTLVIAAREDIQIADHVRDLLT
ncbi:acetate/propionate family kinase [Salinactinospora qingdaonensis]|uniref:Acetate kinase n=1 Tax=Salinactinospora qingdaonensis TaxID=702744 RepID=A0ABP7EWU8_9ACTN